MVSSEWKIVSGSKPNKNILKNRPKIQSNQMKKKNLYEKTLQKRIHIQPMQKKSICLSLCINNESHDVGFPAPDAKLIKFFGRFS